MKYLKIYHDNVVTARHNLELTRGEFMEDVTESAMDQVAVDEYDDDDGETDWEALEVALYNAENMIIAAAKTDSGYNAGDYSLYIKD